MKRTFSFLLAVIVLAISSSFRLAKAQQPFNSSAIDVADKALHEANRTFVRLYMSRYEKDVTEPILSFALKGVQSDSGLRSRAIVALGRIENPQSEAPLQKLLDELEEIHDNARFNNNYIAPVDEVPLSCLKLALGRIRTRKLKGEAKLNAVANSIGLTWKKVQEMGDELKKAASSIPPNYKLLESSFQQEVVTEFLDVLRSMRIRGEDLNRVGAFRLAYNDSQRLLLTSSHLSRKKEAKFWLQRALPPANVEFNPIELVNLGNEMKPILLRYMRKFLVVSRDNPQMIDEKGAKNAKKMIFAACATGDLQFIPIIEEFTKISNPEIAEESRQTLEYMRSGGANFLVPCKMPYGNLYI